MFDRNYIRIRRAVSNISYKTATTYLPSRKLFTHRDINMNTGKSCIAIDKLSAMLVLLYSCIIRALTKRLEKKLDGKYRRMVPVDLNKSCKQHSTETSVRPLTSHLSNHSRKTNKTC